MAVSRLSNTFSWNVSLLHIFSQKLCIKCSFDSYPWCISGHKSLDLEPAEDGGGKTYQH